MSTHDKQPLSHSAPIHDASESKPGMDSLAPEDGSHRRRRQERNLPLQAVLKARTPRMKN